MRKKNIVVFKQLLSNMYNNIDMFSPISLTMTEMDQTNYATSVIMTKNQHYIVCKKKKYNRQKLLKKSIKLSNIILGAHFQRLSQHEAQTCILIELRI